MAEMRIDYWRQMDFYPDNRRDHVIVVGAGSIGSYVAFGLARMGVKKVTVIDFDTVTGHNLPNQFFAEEGLSENIPKVSALYSTVGLILKNNPIVPVNAKVENVLANLLTTNPEAVVVTVDSMSVRKDIFAILDRENYKGFLIDGRVGGENVNIFCASMKGLDITKKKYSETLYDDGEVPDLPCTARSIVDISMETAGQLINRVRHSLMGKPTVFWTFHDYSYGTSWAMEYGLADPAIVEEESIKHLGGSDGEDRRDIPTD